MIKEKITVKALENIPSKKLSWHLKMAITQ
jgi:hypothetical protein